MLTWSQNGIQQSRDVRQPIGIATSRVAQLRQLFFIYGFGIDLMDGPLCLCATVGRSCLDVQGRTMTIRHADGRPTGTVR